MTDAWPDNIRITPIRQEQLKQRLGDSFRELDLPVKVEFMDGSREALVIVIESEARDRAEFLEYLATVCIQISLLMKTRRVVPVAFYPFRKKPLAESFSLRDDSRSYLDFTCLSCVLGTMNAHDYEASKNIVARLCLPLMAQDPGDKPRLVTRAYEGLIEFESDAGKRLKYSEFISQYAQLNEDQEAAFREKYVEESPFREDIMTLADIWEERGKAEGKVELVLELFSDGMLTAKQARARLKTFLKRGSASKEIVLNALAQLPKAQLPK